MKSTNNSWWTLLYELRDIMFDESKKADIKEIVRESAIYRHFKGGYYVVQNIAYKESSGELIVVYKSLQDGVVWVRPVNEFNEAVPLDEHNPTKQKIRFEKVNNFCNQLSLIPTEELLKELYSRNDNPVVLTDVLDAQSKVWRTYYVIGTFETHYVDSDTTIEDFNIERVFPMEDFDRAIKAIQKSLNPRWRMMKQVFIHQDI